MMSLKENLTTHFPEASLLENAIGQPIFEITKEMLLKIATQLRDHTDFQFNQLMDLAGVDYLSYGTAEWQTHAATSEGFDRGVEAGIEQPKVWDKPRFAVVSQLLSTHLNHRLTLRIFLEEDDLSLESLVSIWPSSDWFEREAFDLYGIVFKNHPDLRRILTDYGFIGHPFRKDFPVSGEVEMRYDGEKQRVVYEPVEIEPRVLVPKVIRK